VLTLIAKAETIFNSFDCHLKNIDWHPFMFGWI